MQARSDTRRLGRAGRALTGGLSRSARVLGCALLLGGCTLITSIDRGKIASDIPDASVAGQGGNAGGGSGGAADLDGGNLDGGNLDGGGVDSGPSTDAGGGSGGSATDAASPDSGNDGG